MANNTEPSASNDVLLVHSPTEHGDGVNVIRKRGEAIEIGELRPTVEGKPITGEVVKLSPRAENPRLFDVDVLVPGRGAPHAASTAANDASRKGPAHVATDRYRMNWDSIFGSRTRELN